MFVLDAETGSDQWSSETVDYGGPSPTVVKRTVGGGNKRYTLGYRCIRARDLARSTSRYPTLEAFGVIRETSVAWVVCLPYRNDSGIIKETIDALPWYAILDTDGSPQDRK